jgi:ArsR family transcriptional regulator
MLGTARKRLAQAENVDVRAGELEALPVDDGELDAALLFLVLHYVAEPAAALAEARRVLRPGGTLLVVDMAPHDREEYRQAMGHVWLGFGADALEGWMRDAGFAGVRYVPLPPDPAAKGPSLFAARATAE